MKIFFFPRLLQSSTAKQIGKPSPSMFLVAPTRLAERYVFVIITYPPLWRFFFNSTLAMAALPVSIDQEIGMDQRRG
jgi:hypothetical protein